MRTPIGLAARRRSHVSIVLIVERTCAKSRRQSRHEALPRQHSQHAVEVEAHGCGLNIRDAQMEKIFVKQAAEENNDDAEERFKFWIEVDIYSMEDE